MTSKWALITAGAILAGACGLCPAGEKPPASADQQAVAAQASVAQAKRGEGKLIELKVPAAKSFKTSSGRTGWKLKVPGGRPLATPAVVKGILFIGGGFGSYEFYALDAVTGKRLWTFKCGDDGPTAAVVDEGCVAYNTESCTIYIHDVETGKVLWHKWLGDPLMSQPAIGGGKVFMAYPGKGGHRLGAFALRTGKVIWDKKIAAEVITAPVVAGDFVMAATVDGTLYCFGAATGKLHWSQKCKVTSAPRILDGQVLISQRGEKKIELKDDKGKKTTSTITVEGLNAVSLADGQIAHAGPLSPVKAAFLADLAAQHLILYTTNTVFVTGEMHYRQTLDACYGVLEDIAGNPVPEAAELLKRIKKLQARKAADKSGDAEKYAQEALEIAKAIEKIAAAKPETEKEKKAYPKLKALAQELRATAAKTKEAAQAANQAEKTIKATKREVKEAQDQDAGVGFADAPAAAKLDLAKANIGQGNVKAVWAYQGSRPCLFEGLSIMVHGPRMRAVDTKTGKVVWELSFDFKAEATRPVTPPALAGGKLYVGTVDGRIVCVDAAKGKIIWQEKVGGRIVFEPSVVKGRVYAATGDGVLICLKTDDKTADGWHMWGGSAKHNGQEKSSPK